VKVPIPEEEVPGLVKVSTVGVTPVGDVIEGIIVASLEDVVTPGVVGVKPLGAVSVSADVMVEGVLVPSGSVMTLMGVGANWLVAVSASRLVVAVGIINGMGAGLVGAPKGTGAGVVGAAKGMGATVVGAADAVGAVVIGATDGMGSVVMGATDNVGPIVIGVVVSGLL
jgi:hypothetical protein